jgi:hypothetical protein
MDDLSRLCCQNPACPEYGVRDGETSQSAIALRQTKPTPPPLLQCLQGAIFRTQGYPLLPSASAPREGGLGLGTYSRGLRRVRKTERLVGVHRDTVTRYSRLAGEHASKAHDELLVAFSPEDRRGPVR